MGRKKSYVTLGPHWDFPGPWAPLLLWAPSPIKKYLKFYFITGWGKDEYSPVWVIFIFSSDFKRY